MNNHSIFEYMYRDAGNFKAFCMTLNIIILSNTLLRKQSGQTTVFQISYM